MFSELTDEQIVTLKKQITDFLSGNNNFATQSITDESGMSLTLNHQNAWKFLEELTKEQRSRQRSSNPFIAIDLR